MESPVFLEHLEDRRLHPAVWVLDVDVSIDIVEIEAVILALTDVRFCEVFLEGGEVALLNEEATLCVFSDADYVVGVIRKQAELGVRVDPLTPDIDHQKRVGVGSTVEPVFDELESTNLWVTVTSKDEICPVG